MSVPLPTPTIVLTVYMWFSMTIYAYLIYVIITKARYCPSLRSSYYSLFLLDAGGCFLLFLHYELIMRPRKYNYFDLYKEDMGWFPCYSMFVLYIGKGVRFLTEMIIAMNRFTVFRFPLHHQQTSIIIVYVAVWTVSAIAALPFVFNSDRVKFVFAPNGILQMYGGTAYDSIHSVALLSLVVIVCTILYCSAIRYTRNNLTSGKLTVLDRNLLLCALFSALPVLAEFARAVISGYATLFEKKLLYAVVTEWGLYQMEIIVTLPAWLQLLVNANLRCIAFATLRKSSTLLENQRTRTNAWE